MPFQPINTPYEKIGDEVRSLADEVPFDIPDSWEWVRMKYICQLIDGEKIQNASYHNLDARYMRGKAEPQTLNSGKYVSQGTYLILVDGENSGEVFIAPEDGYMGSTFKVLWITTQLFAPYVLKFIELYKEPLRNAKRGAAIPHLNKELFFNLPIPMPPIEEQRRIVEKIDEVSSAVSAYDIAYRKTESLNTAFPEALKKSILQEAVQGKLVPQDPSDEPAEALLERIRAEKQRLIKEGKIKKDKHESVIFRRDNSHYEKRGSEEVCIDDEIPFEIPENWTWTRLKNICSLIGDIDHNMPKSVSSDVGVLFLSAKDLLDDGTINYTQNAKYISRADFERLSRKALPQKHDIIYSRIGAALGKARLVEIDREFLVSYSCCVVRPLLVYAPYIRYYLESPQILLHSIKARQSIGVPDLGMGEIKKYLVALPPYNEQVRIVEQLEVLLDRCDFKK